MSIDPVCGFRLSMGGVQSVFGFPNNTVNWTVIRLVEKSYWLCKHDSSETKGIIVHRWLGI